MSKYYFGSDWSNMNMAIARMSAEDDYNNIDVVDVPSDMANLKAYLKEHQGTKILTLEEGDTSQWIYAELKDYADKVLVCNPYRNRLLCSGPKDDKIYPSRLKIPINISWPFV